MNESDILSAPVAMLKQVIFSHMLSREAEEETEEKRLSREAEGPSGGAEGPSAADSQKENPPPPTGATELPDPSERNGEATNRKI